MPERTTIFITGVTGQQGGAIAHELMGSGFDLRAMTRKPESLAAKALADRGVSVLHGDLNDEASLRIALAGAWGAYSVQNTRDAGVQGEEDHGKRFAKLANSEGIQHLVYSSVGSAHRRTGIPHFENKWRVEGTIRGLLFPSHVILRPVFFMENLLTPWFLSWDTISAALGPQTVLQMIAVRDIRKYGALAFTDAARLNRREIDIAGDALTLPAAAARLSLGLGRPIEYQRIPIEEVRKNSEDMALMLEWFDRGGYDVDIPALEREFGIPPTRFACGAAQQRAG